MEFSGKQAQIIGGIVVLVVIVLAVVLWQRSNVSAPAIPPGQTLADPLGGQPAPPD
jgi:hypothetical protein